MTRDLLGVAVAAVTIAPAFAADLPVVMPVKAPLAPVVAPVRDWTQFYIGTGIGFDVVTGSTAASGGVGAVPVQLDGLQGADLGVSVTDGFDVQVSRWFVLGGFADYDWSRQDTKLSLISTIGSLSLTTAQSTADGPWAVGPESW